MSTGQHIASAFDRDLEALQATVMKMGGLVEAAIQDADARIVWVAQGGYGATRLLPRLAPSLVARHAKLLVGFSDATALHATWQRAGVASIHGPNLSTLAAWTPAARDELFGMLREQRENPALQSARCFVPCNQQRHRIISNGHRIAVMMFDQHGK